MNREVDRKRKRVAVLGGSIAAMSGTAPLLMSKHPQVFAGYMAIIGAAVVFLFAEIAKLRRTAEGCR